MKKALTIHDLITHLTESHLDLVGGYPYDFVWVGKRLFVAELDPGKDYARTRVEVYTRKQLDSWLHRARKYQEKYPEEDARTCFVDTAK